jgi:hypothetical protein
MNPLLRYYLRQAGRGSDGVVGPIYSVLPFVQRGNGFGNILGGMRLDVRPLLWSGAKNLGQATLRTGGRILTDMADKSPDTPTRDIVSRHMSEFTQKLVKKLRGGGRKRKNASRAAGSGPTKKQRNPQGSLKEL